MKEPSAGNNQEPRRCRLRTRRALLVLALAFSIALLLSENLYRNSESVTFTAEPSLESARVPCNGIPLRERSGSDRIGKSEAVEPGLAGEAADGSLKGSAAEKAFHKDEPIVVIHWRDDSFDHIIEDTARRYGVDPALVMAIIMAESGYDPMAESHRGARGLMQLMPRTAESLGVEDVFNPEENIDAGVRYFKRLLDVFDEQTELALAAYNAGSRRVREYQGVPPFPATRIYIEKVFQYYRYFQYLHRDELDRA